MERISAKRRMPLLRLRDVYWGASAGFVGIVLGLILVRAESQIYTGTELTGDSEQVASIAVVDDFDAYVDEMTSEGEE